MIDCGIGYGALEKELYETDYLLITHIHTDHLKQSTFNRIRKSFPHIKVAGNYEIAYQANVDVITADLAPVTLGDWIVTPFPCAHDVVCQGFVLEKEDLAIIYATDTATLEHAPARKYDYFFLESNHDETKIKQLQGKKHKYGYDVWQSAQRHLSTQKSKAFYYTHRRSKESEYIELHQSKRFY